jgi:predicted LPLAT superfamily acyltransferase
MASQDGHCDVVEALLRGGADVNKAKKDGTTPLFMASQKGHCDVVEALLRGGADVNKARNDGATPLFMASHNGRTPCVEALVRARADLTLALRGKTPLQAATREGHADVVSVLEAAAAEERARAAAEAAQRMPMRGEAHAGVGQRLGLQWGACAGGGADASADAARRCRLLLLDICEDGCDEVGRGTREVLEDSVRLLAQWMA